MRAMARACSPWVLAALLLAGCSDGPAPGATWSGGVAQLVHRSCTPCHREGQPAPFVLRSFEDVAKRAAMVERVVTDRYMPPWLPTHGDFEGDRRLSADEVESVRAWVAAGTPRHPSEGPLPEPVPPVFASGWQLGRALGEPHAVVELATDFTVPATGRDLVRNLVLPLDPGLFAGRAMRYVEGFELQPGSAAVHHAVVALDRTRSSRQRDALDAEPGFPGMDMGGAEAPDGHFLGWTPGKQPRRQPAGQAFRLHGGSDLVLQLHLVPTGKPEQVRPRIALWFTDVPTAVEFVPLVLYDDRIEVPAGAHDVVVQDHLVVPADIRIHAVYPHAHRICSWMDATLVLPSGERRLLHRIDRWDFDWQDDYRFREPVAVPAGTRIEARWAYDNRAENPANPFAPPRTIRFGQSSDDEMATLSLTVEPSGPDARLQLFEAVHRRDLEKRPGDAMVWMRLGSVLRQQQRLTDAEAALERALAIDPRLALAWHEVGICREIRGDHAGAEEAQRTAVAADGALALARVQLGTLLGRRGEHGAAIAEFEQALDRLPYLPLLHANLGLACFAEGRLDRAEASFRRTLELEPRHFGAQFQLGRVLAARGRTEEARASYEAALRLRPGDPAVTAALQQLAR